MYKKITKDLLDFIWASPTAFHVVDNIKVQLDNKGYSRLLEGKEWNLKPGNKYYVIRN